MDVFSQFNVRAKYFKIVYEHNMFNMNAFMNKKMVFMNAFYELYVSKIIKYCIYMQMFIIMYEKCS